MKKPLLLKNCLLYNSTNKSNPVNILIEDSKISFVGKYASEKKLMKQLMLKEK